MEEKKRITEIKCTRNISFVEARKIVEQTHEQPSYEYVTKKGNEEKEDTKQELNKLIKELKNLIEILKMITKETIREHISTVPDKYVTHNQNQEKKNPKQRKGKIQTKQKTLINESIPLSKRFNPMDIDPVETTTHFKTDSINLQKKLHKKNKYQRQPNRK